MFCFVYATYRKDLSIKTTTAKIQMMKQGKYVGGYAPYGYILHPTIRNKLALDPEAAQIVRRVFDMAIAGSGVIEIAKQLNAEGIPTPGQYFISKNPGTGKFRHTSDKLNWSYAAVHGILTKLTHMEVCGSDIGIINIKGVREHMPIWDGLIGRRKSPFRQAALIGIGTLIAVLFRRYSLEGLVKKVSRRIGIKVRAIVWNCPEPCMDIDKPHQMDLLKGIMEGENSGKDGPS